MILFKLMISYLLLLDLFFYISCKIIQTTHGKISGKKLKTLLENKEYFGFMGIPYALPPIGELRFLEPQPSEPWNGVLSMTKERLPCIQFNVNIKKGQPFGVYGAEDCLYLDIFTPALDENKRATIVLLYNEYFINSYNITKDYGPDFIIEEDVIFVSISHRLSSFGFLSLEDDILPGNAGLKDISLALEWINKNIAYFGGDPDKITLMGVKGGAAAVDLLIHSKSRKFIHSAILQSGSSLNPAYLQENLKDRTKRLGELLEINTKNEKDLLKKLQNVAPEKILLNENAANDVDYTKENQRNAFTFGPIVEKTTNGLIMQYPEKFSDEMNIPIMIGFNSREGLEPSLQYLLEPRYLTYLEKDFGLIMPRRVKFKLDLLQDSYYDAIEDIKNFYFPRGIVTVKNVPEYISYIGDLLTSYSVDNTAKLYADKSCNVYYYHFDYVSELNENKDNILKLSSVSEGTWGAASGDELCYLFKCPSLTQRYLKIYKKSLEEIKIQRIIVKLWTNFAKYSNPTPEHDNPLKDFEWPLYDKKNKLYLNIHNPIEAKNNLNSESINFWDTWLDKYQYESNNLQTKYEEL